MLYQHDELVTTHRNMKHDNLVLHGSNVVEEVDFVSHSVYYYRNHL